MTYWKIAKRVSRRTCRERQRPRSSAKSLDLQTKDIFKRQADVADGHAVLKVQLRYVAEGQPMVTGMQRVSKPGRRVYVGIKDIPRVKNGIGVAILSTSKGLMTDQDSRRAGLGGEVLCSIW